MELPINEKGNIELELFTIVHEVINRATEEEREAIVEYFGFQKPIQKWMIDKLADEYSRPAFYEGWHIDRLELLRKIKQEELDYYASLICSKLSDERRHHNAYWELYYFCREKGVTSMEGFPHRALKTSDWDWRRELEEFVKEIIKTERPDLLEVKSE